MPVNLDKPHLWNADIQRSVELYNDWFMQFAPQTYQETRIRTTEAVEHALVRTNDLMDIEPDVLAQEPRVLPILRMATSGAASSASPRRTEPRVLPILRMATAPPIARDRLVGLAGVSRNLVSSMEHATRPRTPPSMAEDVLRAHLDRIGAVIERLADRDLFSWLQERRTPTTVERHRAATIVADRLCGAQTDPIIRNAQEAWQLAKIKEWLEVRGYVQAAARTRLHMLTPGTFAFRLNAEGTLESGAIRNIPIDVVIVPQGAKDGALPLMIEAKSAGDYTNVNKRRKEEADKVANLRRRYGPDVRFILFLRGYFDSGYLGYEAAAGIDWVWEHRIDDLAQFGV